MAQSVEHIVHIDGVVGSSPTVTTRAEAVENQRLLLLCLHPGVHCPGVVFVGVNGSDNPNCQNCRLAQLPELSGWLHWWKGAAFVSLTYEISCQQVSSQTVSYLRLISMMISSSYASPV